MENNQTHQKFEDKFDQIMQNDLPHIYSELTELKTNVSWIMKFMWVVITASVSGLIVSLINLLK